MGKLRVHELAKKLGLENKELLEKLKNTGLDAKTHSSTVDEAEVMKALNAGQVAPPAPPPRSTVVRRAASPTPEPTPEPTP
ncbi:MAG TPA: translation initiation factor IF-2 N-terminal domain-containing protein, partial [Myxococcota bacterium]